MAGGLVAKSKPSKVEWDTEEAQAITTPTTNSNNSISIRLPAKMAEKYKRPPIRPPERPYP
ncbi:hypothetical protein C2G38_2229448 [Gigaspora rosea]|uniref:Uncharacterized protein n=1 Tax=Gigaspora rosea TaxID=44941 RepID=A0A397TYH3_9GLOM|nr:hypothetical protein C2G38_2229448 [Gigaspora rosea]